MESSDQNLVDSSVSTSGDDDVKGSVAYESFRKSVEAEKAARKRAQELEAQLESIRTKELEEKGKYQELVEQYKNKTQELETTLKTERDKYAWNTVTGAIRLEAQKSGCMNPDKLIKLLDKSDFEMLQAENGSIKSDSLAQLMDKAKKENAFLFSQDRIKMNDTVPRSKPETKEQKKSPKEMTPKEIEEALLALHGKK